MLSEQFLLHKVVCNLLFRVIPFIAQDFLKALQFWAGGELSTSEKKCLGLLGLVTLW
jgi:hypothetical protein